MNPPSKSRLAASRSGTQLLERERELNELNALLDAAWRGRGGIALADGAAGIGKTRLLEAAGEQAAALGFQVLTARGSDLERPFAYGVVRQLFEAAVLDAGSGAAASPLRGPAAYAEPVFGSNPFPADASEAPDRSEAVLHGLYWLTSNLAESAPVLIVVDDAHWADAPSLLFLYYLARRLGRMSVAVVVGTRHGQHGPEADLVERIAADAPASVLELHPLSQEATATLVRSLLLTNADDDLCRACHAATGGNPFLVHELVTALVADDVSSADGAALRVGRLVPAAVARQVLVRLSRLGAAAISVAHAVAVLGAGTQLRHAALLAGLTQPEAAAAVDALVAADILSPDGSLWFAHPLLAEAVYADARPGERLLAHARAAKTLADTGSPPERVALQLLAAEPAGSEWAVEMLREAAREAGARGAPRTAARYLERALAEPPAEADRRDVLFELGVAESRATLPAAADHLSEALKLTVDPVARARVAQQLAGLYNLLGRFVESADVLEEAIDALGAGEPELRFGLQAEVGVLAVTALDARRRVAPRMADFRASAPAVVGLPAAAPLLAVVAHELADTDGTAREVAAFAEEALTDALVLTREGAVAVVAAAALVTADRPLAAEAILDAAISEARARGSIQAMRGHLVCRAYARNRRGRPADAEADARLSLELSEDEPSDPVRPFRVSQLAEALIERAELDEAATLLTPAELARHDRDSKLYQPLSDVLAKLLMLRGRPRDALELLSAQLAWRRAWGSRNPGWTSAGSLAPLVHHALGEVDAARALAAEHLDAARAFGAPRGNGIALRTMALVEPGPGIDLLRESAEVLEESEARLELARTLVELGAALRRDGARRDARQPLRRGLEIAHETGGALVGERARAELLATGARPRRHRSTGREAITASELRVATLARDGRSNREIAGTLFLSTKTVEMHLSHVYGKLGIRSRTQLASALDEHESTGR